MSESNDRSCRQAPGVMVPVIERNRCEGRVACVAGCPTKAFTPSAFSCVGISYILR
jgi:ferredoxin